MAREREQDPAYTVLVASRSVHSSSTVLTLEQVAWSKDALILSVRQRQPGSCTRCGLKLSFTWCLLQGTAQVYAKTFIAFWEVYAADCEQELFPELKQICGEYGEFDLASEPVHGSSNEIMDRK